MNKNMIKQKRRLGFSLGIFIIVCNIVSTVLTILAKKTKIVSEQNEYLIAFAINAISIYIVGYAIYILLLKKVPAMQNAPPKKLKPSEFLLLACITIGATQLVNISFQIILIIIKLFLGIEINNNVAELLENSNPIISFIFAGIIGPIFEELIIRSTLLKRVRIYGDRAAIIYTAISFGLFHCNIEQIPYTMVCGLILGYTAVKTNNIKYSILLHILLNSFSVILGTFFKYNLMAQVIGITMLEIICIILTIVFVPIKIASGKLKISNESEFSRKNLYKNIGFITTVIIVLAITILQAIKI